MNTKDLEEAINKSGGRNLGNPDYILTDMATVKVLREAAQSMLELMQNLELKKT